MTGFVDLPVFFSTIEVRLNGCLATCHPESLLRKTINGSLLMLSFVHWPEELRNYHVLRETNIIRSNLPHL